jgi:hypothetical protein
MITLSFIIIGNVLPQDERKVEKVDRRQKDEE